MTRPTQAMTRSRREPTAGTPSLADAARIDAEVRERDRERSPGAAYPADRNAAGSWQDIKSAEELGAVRDQRYG
jgi:hypothetical protein